MAKKVIAVVTTLAHLDYNKVIANAPMKDALVKAIKDAYIAKLGAGYTAAHISVTLSSGSVKAEVKITPTGDATVATLKDAVTAAKADLDTQVLKKAKELPKLSDFLQRGKTLADVTATSTAPVESTAGTTTKGSEDVPIPSSSICSQCSALILLLLQVVTSRLL